LCDLGILDDFANVLRDTYENSRILYKAGSIFLSLCDKVESYCNVWCRKVRLQIKDETEREEVEMKAVHAEKLRKLQKDLEQQLTEEKSKSRYELWAHHTCNFLFFVFLFNCLFFPRLVPIVLDDSIVQPTV